MTTELEQEFFKVFGIEPKIRICERVICIDDSYGCNNCKYSKNEYLKITDRKLLEMICIFSQHCNFGRWNKYVMHSIDDFEYIMLSQLIEYQKKRYTYGIKEKIQQLFKEEE